MVDAACNPVFTWPEAIKAAAERKVREETDLAINAAVERQKRENRLPYSSPSPASRPDLYECASCMAKSGSPALCDRCLKARDIAGKNWLGGALHFGVHSEQVVGSPEWWAAFHEEHGRDPTPAEMSAEARRKF
jgi:hypothetical protein